MENKDNIVEVKADLDDLLLMFGSALRYGLGRQSYAPSVIMKVITDNLALLNEKWTVNLLNDIQDYETELARLDSREDYDRYIARQEFADSLLALYKERRYTHPLGEK